MRSELKVPRLPFVTVRDVLLRIADMHGVVAKQSKGTDKKKIAARNTRTGETMISLAKQTICWSARMR
jgi:hypothetical protein